MTGKRTGIGLFGDCQSTNLRPVNHYLPRIPRRTKNEAVGGQHVVAAGLRRVPQLDAQSAFDVRPVGGGPRHLPRAAGVRVVNDEQGFHACIVQRFGRQWQGHERRDCVYTGAGIFGPWAG